MEVIASMGPALLALVLALRVPALIQLRPAGAAFLSKEGEDRGVERAGGTAATAGSAMSGPLAQEA